MTGFSRLAVAFSGGVDSTLLAYAAGQALGREGVLLLLADSVLTPRSEVAAAVEWARAVRLPLELVAFDPLADDAVAVNDGERCYHCKKRLLGRLLERAREAGFDLLADGTNLDDLDDYRPGLRACRELGIVHPLQEAGLDKAAVRALARFYGLPNWARPAAACLASRIAAGQPLDRPTLAGIEAAEEYLKELGFSGIRARRQGNDWRLELRREEDYRLLLARRGEIVSRLNAISGGRVSLDLGGYSGFRPVKK